MTAGSGSARLAVLSPQIISEVGPQGAVGRKTKGCTVANTPADDSHGRPSITVPQRRSARLKALLAMHSIQSLEVGLFPPSTNTVVASSPGFVISKFQRFKASSKSLSVGWVSQRNSS